MNWSYYCCSDNPALHSSRDGNKIEEFPEATNYYYNDKSNRCKVFINPPLWYAPGGVIITHLSLWYAPGGANHNDRLL